MMGKLGISIATKGDLQHDGDDGDGGLQHDRGGDGNGNGNEHDDDDDDDDSEYELHICHKLSLCVKDKFWMIVIHIVSGMLSSAETLISET